MIDWLIAFAAAAEPTAAVGAVPQTSNPSGQSAPIVVQGQQAPEKRVVCSIETPTGSLFAKKVCRTVAEVEQNRAESQALIQEAGRIQTLGTNTDKNNLPK